MLIDVEERLARQYHFEVTDHRLTFLGICQDCQRKQVIKEVKDDATNS